MSRYVDALPPPTKSTEVEVIVLSPSRSATLATYKALKILGYNTYHNYESFAHGVPHMKMYNEAMRAVFHGECEVYTRPDFDKWFQGYNALTELPSYFPHQITAAYPSAKYILVERSPESWAKSVMHSVVKMTHDVDKFPTNILRHFDEGMDTICKNAALVSSEFSGGKFDGEGGLDSCEKWYREYITLVKSLVPASQLLTINLEREELNWTPICTFLNKPVPKSHPWPARHTPEEFQATLAEFMMPSAKRAITKIGITVILPLVLVVAGGVMAMRGQLGFPLRFF